MTQKERHMKCPECGSEDVAKDSYKPRASVGDDDVVTVLSCRDCDWNTTQ